MLVFFIAYMLYYNVTIYGFILTLRPLYIYKGICHDNAYSYSF